MRDLTPDIEQISEIVAFPTVIAEIQAEILKENVASVRVAQLVKTDATLTAQVLRAVNSPFYGLRWEVTSVTQAIAMLGIDEIGRLVLLFHLRQQMFKLDHQQAEFLDRLWRHSLSTAIVAQAMASKFELLPFGKAFTAGLLHDIGKIVLAQYYPVHLEEISQMTNEIGLADVDGEQQMVGINHAEIGARLCEKWTLPIELVHVIRRHHDRPESDHFSLLTSSVRFADLLCESWEVGIGEQQLPLELENEPSWLLLKGTSKKLQEIPFEEVNRILKEELDTRSDLFHISTVKNSSPLEQ